MCGLPYGPMLCNELGDELRLVRTRNIQWAVAGAELSQVPKYLVSWMMG